MTPRSASANERRAQLAAQALLARDLGRASELTLHALAGLAPGLADGSSVDPVAGAAAVRRLAVDAVLSRLGLP